MQRGRRQGGPMRVRGRLGVRRMTRAWGVSRTLMSALVFQQETVTWARGLTKSEAVSSVRREERNVSTQPTKLGPAPRSVHHPQDWYPNAGQPHYRGQDLESLRHTEADTKRLSQQPLPRAEPQPWRPVLTQTSTSALGRCDEIRQKPLAGTLYHAHASRCSPSASFASFARLVRWVSGFRVRLGPVHGARGARTEAAPEMSVQAGLDGETSIAAPRLCRRFRSQRRAQRSLVATPRSAAAHCDTTSSSLATQPDTAISAVARPLGDGGPRGRKEKAVAVAVRSKTARLATRAPALAAETDAPMPVSDASVLFSIAETTLPPAATTSPLVAIIAFRTPAPAPLCTPISPSPSREKAPATEGVACS
eukprot:1621643-Rhodomonas_salina.4